MSRNGEMPRSKWDYPFLDPRFKTRDLDAEHLHELEGIELKPVVFIQGLHRSGTTFLLNTLHDLFPAASTSVYHIAFYRQLLHAEKNGESERYRRLIAHYLERHGLRDRRIDAVEVSADSLDEYGFIYDRLRVRRAATWLLREIRAKLSYLHPEARLVLLKDPVSFASFVLLRSAVPDARFIFIHRDPERVLHSLFRAQMTRHRYHGREPFMALLMGWKPGLPQSVASRFVPRRMRRRQAASFFPWHVGREIETYTRELPFLPRDRYLDVSYEGLVDDTEATLGRIVDFLGIEPERSLASVRPRPRPAPPLPAELVEPAARLRKRLADLGYPPTPGVDR